MERTAGGGGGFYYHGAFRICKQRVFLVCQQVFSSPVIDIFSLYLFSLFPSFAGDLFSSSVIRVFYSQADVQEMNFSSQKWSVGDLDLESIRELRQAQ